MQGDGDNRVDIVVVGEWYAPVAVVLGGEDGHYDEVISGLEAGERVVASNSYIIKADLEKSEAGHDH